MMRCGGARGWALGVALLGGVSGAGAHPEGSAGAHLEHAPGEGPPPPASAVSRWVTPSPPSDPTLLRLPARLVAGPSARGVVAPLVAGRVEAVRVRVGDTVAAGQAVVEITAPVWVEAEAAARAASGRLAPVVARLETVSPLRRDGLLSADALYALQSQRADLEAERARAESALVAAGLDRAARARLAREGRVALRAPVAGVVRSIRAQLGEVRGPDDGPLVEIAGRDAARVEVSLVRPLPPHAVLVFVDLSGARLSLASAPLATVPAEHEAGVVAYFSPEPPDRALPHGLAGQVEVSMRGEDVLEVPRSALWFRAAPSPEQAPSGWVARRVGDHVEWVEVEVLTAGGARALVHGHLSAEDAVAADARLLLARMAEGEHAGGEGAEEGGHRGHAH